MHSPPSQSPAMATCHGSFFCILILLLNWAAMTPVRGQMDLGQTTPFLVCSAEQQEGTGPCGVAGGGAVHQWREPLGRRLGCVRRAGEQARALFRRSRVRFPAHPREPAVSQPPRRKFKARRA